jgi:hypothetical protein
MNLSGSCAHPDESLTTLLTIRVLPLPCVGHEARATLARPAPVSFMPSDVELRRSIPERRSTCIGPMHH